MRCIHIHMHILCIYVRTMRAQSSRPKREKSTMTVKKSATHLGMPVTLVSQ